MRILHSKEKVSILKKAGVNFEVVNKDIVIPLEGISKEHLAVVNSLSLD